MSNSDIIFVRIKPHNPRKGYRLRRYLVFGMKFEEEKGWYRINSAVNYGGQQIDVAAYLGEVRNSEIDEDSALAFDIATEAEAKAIDAREKKAREKKASAAEPNASAAIDLTSNEVSGSTMGSTQEAAAKKRRAPRSVRAATQDEV